MGLQLITDLLPNTMAYLKHRASLVPIVLERLKRAGIEIKGDGIMPEFKLRRVNDSIGYDLGIDENNHRKGLFYNGKPIKVDLQVLVRSEVVGHAFVATELLNQMYNEFEQGGECNACGDSFRELFVIKDEWLGHFCLDGDQAKICPICWNEMRSEIQKQNGEDIGPCNEHDTSKPCTHCGRYLTDSEQYHIDDKIMFCNDCVALHER